jgi:hypothetical protein
VFEHWDDVELTPPPGAVRADVQLLYQSTSWEYIQFLDLANDGSVAFLADEGQNILEARIHTDMAAPEVMATTTIVVPELGRMLMLLAGMGFLGAVRRRRT